MFQSHKQSDGRKKYIRMLVAPAMLIKLVGAGGEINGTNKPQNSKSKCVCVCVCV